MELQKVKLSKENGIGVIAMTYTNNLNAIDEQMVDELNFAIEQMENDDEVKVVVLKGGEKAFSAGGDIGYFYQLVQGGGDVNMDALIEKAGALSESFKKMRKLVIASVSGAAAGAGFSLALSADMIICADNAKFLMAFVNIGLVPDTGATYLLTKSIGAARTMQLCATGRPLSAQEALEWGLAVKVVPAEELDEEVIKFAGKFVNGPAVSYKNIKKQIYGAEYVMYREFLKQSEALTQRECAATEDFKEGVCAFAEKRKPVFRGI